jgi:hypothetical protein
MQFSTRIYKALRGNFSKYFNSTGGDGEEIKRYQQISGEIEMMYLSLRRNIAKGGGITYTELGRMDIFEFFKFVIIWEKDNAD